MQGMADLKSLLESAQRMQGELARVKEGLGRMTVRGESGGGLVECVCNGRGEVLSIVLDPSLLHANDDAARLMLQELVAGAVNQALDRARELGEQELARVAGGLAWPGGLGAR